MKKLSIMVSLCLSIMFVGFSAHSATLTVAVDDLDALLLDGIVSYQTNFDVSGGSVTSVVKSTDQPINFQINFGSGTVGSELRVLSDNGFNPSPLLLDGNLFTVTYPDTVSLSLTLDSFLLTDNVTVVQMYTIPADTVFGAGDNLLTFTPVPIPPTVLLLGAGLVGLVGIRRRVKS